MASNFWTPLVSRISDADGFFCASDVPGLGALSVVFGDFNLYVYKNW